MNSRYHFPDWTIVTPKNFNGFGGIGNRFVSIYDSEFILFIEMHSQNTKTEDGK